MTLQEAKNEVAKNHRQEDWDDLVTHYTEFDYKCTVPFLEEAAELYASSLRSELAEKEKQLEAADKVIELYTKIFTFRSREYPEIKEVMERYHQLKNTKP